MASTGMSAQSRKEVIVFTIACFALLWIPCGLWIYFGDAFPAFLARFSLAPVLFIAIGALSPSVLGILLTAVWRGWSGVKEHWRRMFRWKVHPFWWAASFLTFPIAFLFTSYASHWLFGTPAEDLEKWYRLMPLVIVTGTVLSDSGPLGEEFGLRGYILPRLLQQWSPFAASILLGTVWSLWHFPAFFIPGQIQADWSFWVFLLMPIGVSLVMTWIHIHARGSGLLSGIIPHMMANIGTLVGLSIVGHWPWTVAFLCAGALVTICDRANFFRRSDEFVFLEPEASRGRSKAHQGS